MLWTRVLRQALCYLVLFFVHRLLILPDIGAQTLSSDAVPILTIGFLSDLSVSCALAFIFIALRLHATFSRLFILLLSILLMGHVTYVQFYHVTLRAMHAPYLWDWSFMKSSASESLLTRGIIHLPLGLVLAVLVPSRLPKQMLRMRLIASVALLALTIGANFLSQTWGRKLNFSEHLRNNVVIGLLVDAQRMYQQKSVLALTEADWNALQSADASLQPFKNSAALSAAQTEKFVQFLSHDQNQTPSLASYGSPWSFLRSALRRQFQSRVLSSQPRHVIVVLMESTRALDSQLYFPEAADAMPELDAIAKQGLRFSNGYSNGTVTRAGAESALCNTQASEDANAMRNAPLSKPVCVAELVSPFLDDQHISYLFTYLHGGYLSFDRQNEFWTQNDFDIPIDILTQPKQLPRTDWGLSDKAFLNLTTEWFKDKSAQNQSGLNFVFVQTMTNHYAWALPEDADDDLKQQNTTENKLKNLLTVKYQSRSLGKWVDDLKTLGIWKNALVLFVGDHGIKDGSWQHPGFYSRGKTDEDGRLQAEAMTRVYYALSGGLVEQAVAECQQAGSCSQQHPLAYDGVVAQSDFLPTLLDVLNITNVPMLGKSYFDEGLRRAPQLIDVESYLYVPEQKLIIKKDEFFNSPQPNLTLLKARQKLYLQLSTDGTFSNFIREKYLTEEE